MAGTISIICRIFEVRLFKRLRNIPGVELVYET
jgi:hypothetical protein